MLGGLVQYRPTHRWLRIRQEATMARSRLREYPVRDRLSVWLLVRVCSWLDAREDEAAAR